FDPPPAYARHSVPADFPSQSTFSILHSLADDAADQLSGVVHHGDHPGVVDAGRADDAHRADDALLAVAVGGDDQGTAGEAEEFAFRADIDLYPLRALGRLEQAGEGLLALQRREQDADPLQVAEGGHILQKLRLAADDQRAALVGGPA